jgi:hypothetical protein
MAPIKLSKTEEAYLYIVKKSEYNVNFGKTLFWKILYFSDFDFYERHERPITSNVYCKAPLGPAPLNFDRTISKLKNEGYLVEKHANRNGMPQIKYYVVANFEIVSLETEEIQEIDRNIKRLEGMTATQVSAYSHQDMPYKATKKGEKIDFELVFYRNPMFSVQNAKN